MAPRRRPQSVLVSLLVLAPACGTALPEAATEASPSVTSNRETASAPNETPPAKPVEENSAAPAVEPSPPAATADPTPPAAAPRPASISCEPPPNRPPPTGKLQISIDPSKVDLEGHSLQVKLNRPACKVVLKVIGESGAILAEAAEPFDGMPAGTALVVNWSPSSPEPVARIEVWGHDTEGFHIGMAITPWNVKIPHEEVNFENDSDAIRPAETPKLEASLQKVKEALAKHKDLGNISLYIAGHTDTMGSAEHNLGLSRRRAKAIAAWFRSHGLKIPIAFEGLGEHAPLVKTADEVSEPRNRRVDYILSLEPPRLPTGQTPFGWKGI